jgi:glutamate dehydrogenase (NAD(P)+)
MTPTATAASTPPTSEESPFATMMSHFDEAARLASIDPGEFEILRRPDREITISVPILRDDGSVCVLDGFRVQHNAGLGPYFGPLRLAAHTELGDLRAMAAWMTWKCALLGIPFGGAAGGIRIDRNTFSQAELERAVRRYIANMMDVIGPERDVFTPEKARDELAMGWLMDTVSMHRRSTTNAIVAGKPEVLGGTRHHHDAAAQGLRIVFELATRHFGLGTERTGPSVIVEGAGYVGGNFASLLHRDDCRVVGLCDKNGGLYNAAGLDIPKILAQRTSDGGLQDVKGDFERMPNADLFRQKCDVLAPCATSNSVTLRNCGAIDTKLILEGQHGAVSAPAYLAIRERGIKVVPDILARGGDTLSGYFEWVQNRMGYAWQAGDILQRMQRFLEEAWVDVVKVHTERDVTLRSAAQIVAVSRVANADRLRGMYA